MTAPQAPLFRAAFTLTRADALAWETRPRDLSPQEKLALFSLIALSGGLYGAMEDRMPVWFLLLPALVQFALLAGAVYGLWRLGRHVAARLRAARRLPRPLPCTFLDQGPHFILGLGTVETQIPWPTLLAVTMTPRHVFLATADRPIILPVRAFPDAASARTRARAWQEQVDLAAARD